MWLRWLVVAVASLGLAACSGTPSPVVNQSSRSAAPSSAGRSAAAAVVIAPTVQQWGRDAGVDIAREARQVEAKVDRLLGSRPVPITIGKNTGYVIPRVGVGGHADPRTGAVSIEVGRTSPLPMGNVLTVQLRRTLAHELNHAARITIGPGYGKTLLDTIVSEGIADDFATSLYPGSFAPWTHALTPSELNRYWRAARPHLDEILQHRPYIHWMFGGGRFPHWTGYTLGAAVVASAKQQHPMTWAGITRQTADQILSASRFGP